MKKVWEEEVGRLVITRPRTSFCHLSSTREGLKNLERPQARTGGETVEQNKREKEDHAPLPTVSDQFQEGFS